MNIGRKILVGLAWLFVLAVAIQFLLAGLGVLGARAWSRTGSGASSSSTSCRS